MIIGIDPGSKGAIVSIPDAGEGGEMKMFAMDSMSEAEILTLLRSLVKEGVKHIFLEKAQSMPKNGSVAMFNYGNGFGYLRGVIASLNVPYTLVPPRIWHKVMCAGVDTKKTSKQRSKIAVERLFPGVDLKKSDRCTTLHDGIIDALLVAEYGRRTLGRMDV